MTSSATIVDDATGSAIAVLESIDAINPADRSDSIHLSNALA
jgi:hypothetical protein